ncbi:MAG: sel1 repeat family protein [Campylobacteraceae bacterium]|nr:sel1 repeat family protein [Campylobacteraceae bacterium]
MRFIVLFTFLLNTTFMLAQDLGKGNEAYKNRDLEVALKYYETACDKGVGEACYRVGEMYDIGLWVLADESKALNYFKKACNLKYDKGCTTVRDRDESLRGGW